ncbi:MAG: hypothetical protein ONB46_05050 [candidate division KSB1 bacterium]|nr:hypothetical protein [candidate division KSB1 bacterium]MDZ7365642.1 hypothetical protein [candidate division KSB1 bacterium]MDZ7403282.1 hypothetical protein [candidate division KSB1 bacterium]
MATAIMKEEIFQAPALDRLVPEGEAIYEKRLKKKLEPKYKGKIIAIEVDSGKYFMGDTVIEVAEKARAVFPDKYFYLKRVGYRAVHKFHTRTHL